MKRPNRFSLGAAVIVAGILALAGIYLVFRSHAATNNADFNNDGTVNITDLSILASHWNQTGLTQTQGDANGDGSANITDLSILATQWGTNSNGGGTTNGCTAYDNGISGFPCPTSSGGSAGIPTGTSLTLVTSCTGTNGSCVPQGLPSGVTWASGLGFNINSCVTISGFTFKDQHGVSIYATNGTTSASTPCVMMTNDFVYGGTAVASGAGPFVITHSEISNDLNGPGTICGGDINCSIRPLSGDNWHGDSLYIHDMSFWSWARSHVSLSNSVVRGFRCDITTTSCSNPSEWPGGDGQHGAAIETNQFNPVSDQTFTHNSLSCNQVVNQYFGTGAASGCSGTITIYPQGSSVDGTTYDNNLFMELNGTSTTQYCLQLGVSASAAGGGTASHINFKNNVWDASGNGGVCGLANNAVDPSTWDPTYAAAHSDTWCNNKFSAGGTVLVGGIDVTTGNCP